MRADPPATHPVPPDLTFEFLKHTVSIPAPNAALIGHMLLVLLERLMSTKCISNALRQTKLPANELSWGGGEQFCQQW